LRLHNSNRLRVAAIDFLNPAPLMWDFEHPPLNAVLRERYDIRYTQPSMCAEDLLAGRADLGLIPIASLDRVRSIQLIVKQIKQVKNIKHVKQEPGGHQDSAQILQQVRTIAADTASRSSLAYAQILFRKFLGTDPEFLPAAADPIAMLALADAALLIGDPALLALESRDRIEQEAGPCLWLDLAHEWCTRTSLPWVAAVWAVQPEAVALSSIGAAQLIEDLQQSRNHGLDHIDSLVAEWTPRIAIPPTTIQHYLTRNIHYTLSPSCIAAIELFRRYASEADILPPLAPLHFL
jgi:chorismate dehydratase